ncbi:MAG: heat-inducible transcriptional repressor HrcA [Clostridia bacterium]|nr:heat-inducible transcriptional repressor HrcA [Clostridia bacterium]
MELDDRKIRILEAIIDDYIKTAEPVGSRTIVKKYDMGVSPATIRNEMADLEELGLLTSPHTSSGRVPSDKGYRLYVDELLQNSQVSTKTRKQIDKLFEKTYSSMDVFIKDLSNLISELTNYTVVASKPHDKRSVIKNIQLITIDPNTILLVTVINKSQVKNNVLKVNESVSQEVLSAIAELLNSELDNLTLSDITLDLIASIKNQLGKYKNILDPILDVITDMINEIDTPDYYASGITNILNFPEFTDVTVARELIGLVENKNMLNNLLTNGAEEVYETVIEDANGTEIKQSDGKNSVSIRIGNENSSPAAKDCSIITYKYNLDDTDGTISIIGPKRMDYDNSISILKAIIKSMELKKGG